MYSIRPIQKQDNASIADVIRQVSKEFGLAPESGFAVADPILDDLYTVYQQPNARYWVIQDESGTIFGGGGISPLKGDADLLEIQKMYFNEVIRGQGFAKQLLELAFIFAKSTKAQACYLETTQSLWQAVKLYEKLGFKHLEAPKGNTGHSHACEIWMLKTLA
ncbi:GNAT family N-acetyltransferase [Acinetobacter tianfuensis]|uniref:GNAT family N-acetyltransferase n=1 Tax=Acinetobacter tianfuensis TaxID=2419603 RepID=A0A3A8ELR9_9GAMM|nr:GNAT family N-acetyltransferase [Acinetobacter tianfuensis]RKG30904.1 GNAT family N-acetyltransferase [Acinetobacter tianfuensis]